MARAHLTAGDLAEVAAWKARATAALDGIADADDREIIEGRPRDAPLAAPSTLWVFSTDTFRRPTP